MNKNELKSENAVLLDVIRYQNAYIRVLERQNEVLRLGAKAAIECMDEKSMR